MKQFNLQPGMFNPQPFTLYQDNTFTVTTFQYHSGIAGLKIQNELGYLTILPFMGLIIWDAVFDGVNLKMDNMFTEPHVANEIVDTYGCFQFSSGLLGNGTPTPADGYQLHGEFPTSRMDHASLLIDDESLTIQADYEYVKGFGDHYLAQPSVTLHQNSGLFDIQMQVTNLSKYQPMPLQYMCHMNYAYVDNATISQNVPDEAFTLRQTVPAHVHPTPTWIAYNEKLKASGELINQLTGAEHYDPEIVFFSKDLTTYTTTAEFKMALDDHRHFLTRFNTADLPITTRWLLYNADQKVAAFALPGTSTPEGRLAAEKNGTLIMLQPGATKSFTVTTGLEK